MDHHVQLVAHVWRIEAKLLLIMFKLVVNLILFLVLVRNVSDVVYIWYQMRFSCQCVSSLCLQNTNSIPTVV